MTRATRGPGRFSPPLAAAVGLASLCLALALWALPCRAADQRPPKDPIPDQVFQAREWLAKGNADAARDDLRRAVAQAPQDVFIRIQLARLEALTGNLDAARDILERILAAESPDNLLALAWLGHVRLGLGDPKGALAAYQRLERLAPDNAFALIGQGASLAALGEPERAAPLLAKAQTLAGEDDLAHMALGELFLRMRLPLNARLELERALELNPRGVPALILAGEAYLRLGLDSLALNAWRQALSLDPASARARFDLLTVLATHAQQAEQAGNAQEATLVWRTMLGYDPTNPLAQERLRAPAKPQPEGRK